MNEPLKITIEAEVLRALIAKAESGIRPMIQFMPNPEVNMRSAYDLRGQKLSEIMAKIQDLLPPEK